MTARGSTLTCGGLRPLGAGSIGTSEMGMYPTKHIGKLPDGGGSFPRHLGGMTSTQDGPEQEEVTCVAISSALSRL